MDRVETASSSAGSPARGTVLDQLKTLLARDGLHAALGFLNGRTRFRFTGVYRAEPPLLRTLRLFDRENPTLVAGGTVRPLSDTYCVLLWEGNTAFSIPDASRDPRLESHAARDSILSYVGVPIRTPSGSVWGTLCHFDVRPRIIPAGEDAVLEGAAPLLHAWLCTNLRVD